MDSDVYFWKSQESWESFLLRYIKVLVKTWISEIFSIINVKANFKKLSQMTLKDFKSKFWICCRYWSPVSWILNYSWFSYLYNSIWIFYHWHVWLKKWWELKGEENDYLALSFLDKDRNSLINDKITKSMSLFMKLDGQYSHLLDEIELESYSPTWRRLQLRQWKPLIPIWN